MENSVASCIKFSDLCNVLDEIRTLTRQDRGKPLTEFMRKYREKGAELKQNNPSADVSFHPVLRLLLPQLERKRGPYGLKEHSLAKRLIKVLCLSPTGTDASRLTSYKVSTNPKDKDFADVAYWILRKHFISTESKLTIADVNKYLDTLAEMNTNNKPRKFDLTLFQLLQNTTVEVEHKWLLRILLKDLHLGLGQNRILNLYHPDAPDFYAANEDMIKLCETLTDPALRLHEINIAIFSPFQPMLSQRFDVAHFKKSGAGLTFPFYVEIKFDGERFQLHMENGTFKYFSRNGYDYTGTYGEDFNTGLFTPLLKTAFKPHVNRIILDGEMMGWDSVQEKFGSKGMSFDVKHLTENTKHKPCLCVFDLLLLNEDILTNKPLRERVALLHTVVNPIRGVIMISHHTEANSTQEILTALNKSMDRKEEGIVFKHPMSVYKPNDRNAGWWKMKHEYFEKGMNDLDLLIMGGYYGTHGHKHKISSFSVGLAKLSIHPDLRLPIGYISFARVSSGLSTEELQTIERKLGPHWKQFGDGNPEKEYNMQWGKDKPDVWIPPDKSCMIMVRATEIIFVRSGEFATNYTLRFPRILKLRFDKPHYDCMSFNDLAVLTGESGNLTKLSKRHLEFSDLCPPPLERKERKVRKRYVAEEVEPVTEVSKLLEGYEFCVLTGEQEWKKAEIETAIREHGGRIVKNEGDSTLCLLVGNDHPRVRSCKQFNVQLDLVKLNWLRRVLSLGVFELYEPKDVLHASLKTKNRFLGEYDRYGEAYTNDASVESLQQLMEIIKETKEYVHLTPNEMESLEIEHMGKSNPTNMFKHYVAYFHRSEPVGHEMEPYMEEVEFKFLGGKISKVLDENVNLIVLDRVNSLHKAAVLRQLGVNKTNAKIVDRTFISNAYRECNNILK